MNPPYEPGRVRYNHGPGGTPTPPPAQPSSPLPSFDAWHREGQSPPPPPPPYDPPRFDLPPPDDDGRGRRRWLPRHPGKWIVRGLAALIVLLVIAIAWLAITAPLSQSLKIGRAHV